MSGFYIPVGGFDAGGNLAVGNVGLVVGSTFFWFVSACRFEAELDLNLLIL